jgi:putative ABC transport system ATP-binding protein
MPKPTILLEDVRFRWPGDSHDTLKLEHWSIPQGKRVFLCGRSGSGKSTLLNIITGILQPQHGSINILGQDIVQLNQSKRDKFRARHMGVIFQQFNLIPYLSTYENIQLSNTFAKKSVLPNRIQELTHQLGLPEKLLAQKANLLSVGQQQRVAVARALFHQPEIIIADEPTSALDSDSRDDFIQLLLDQSQSTASTVLFVSHDKQLANHFDIAIDLEELNQAEGPSSVV